MHTHVHIVHTNPPKRGAGSLASPPRGARQKPCRLEGEKARRGEANKREPVRTVRVKER